MIHLTEKEGEYLKAICIKGILTRKDLAKNFNCSIATVMSHINELYSKFCVHTVAELIYKFYTKQLENFEIYNYRGVENEY